MNDVNLENVGDSWPGIFIGSIKLTGLRRTPRPADLDYRHGIRITWALCPLVRESVVVKRSRVETYHDVCPGKQVAHP